MPTVFDALEPAPVDLRRALHQMRAAGSPAPRATSTRRSEFEEFGAPITSTRSRPRRDRLHRRLAVGGGVADVFLARPVDLGEAPLQHLDDVDGVVDRQRRLRDIGEAVGLRQRQRPRHRPTVSTSVTAPGGSWPMVPITSGCPAWPIRMMWRPAAKCTLGLAVHLADQRAGGVEIEQLALLGIRRHRFRHAVGREHDRRTCRESRPAPRRKPRPCAPALRPRAGCGRSRAAHRPARHSVSSARSTIWMARSTPAQKPRGAASRRVRASLGMVRPVGFRCPLDRFPFAGQPPFPK